VVFQSLILLMRHKLRLCSLIFVWIGLFFQISCTKFFDKQVGNLEKKSKKEFTIRIGEISNFSGTQGEIGSLAHDGIVLAIEEANSSHAIKRKIELVSSDSRGVEVEAFLRTKELVQNYDVVALIGETSSERTRLISKLVEEIKVPLLAPFATDPHLTKGRNWVFRFSLSDVYRVNTMARFGVEFLKAKKIAVLEDPTDPSSVTFVRYFTDHMKQLPQSPAITKINYKNGDQKMVALIQTLKSMKIDALFAPVEFSDLERIVVAVQREKLATKILSTLVQMPPRVPSGQISRLRGVYVVAPFSTGGVLELAIPKEAIDFALRFKRRFGKEPTGTAAIAYDVTNILVRSLKGVDSSTYSAAREEIRGKLSTMEPYRGVTGLISLDQNQNARRGVAIAETQADGTLKAVARYH